MRDIFTEIFENQPVDPMVSARRDSRAQLRKRFYQRAHVGEHAGDSGGFPVLLDGKKVATPARRTLAVPARALAEAITQEWNAQQDVINPARMPLTRLAHAVIDAVTERPQAVAEEVANYLGSDLLFYRAEAPAGLIARQAQSWDPLLAWAHDALGARFVPVEGVRFVEQPSEAIAAARRYSDRSLALGRGVADHHADRFGGAGAGGCARRNRCRRSVGCGPCRRGLADGILGPRRRRARSPGVSVCRL